MSDSKEYWTVHVVDEAENGNEMVHLVEAEASDLAELQLEKVRVEMDEICEIPVNETKTCGHLFGFGSRLRVLGNGFDVASASVISEQSKEESRMGRVVDVDHGLTAHHGVGFRHCVPGAVAVRSFLES